MNEIRALTAQLNAASFYNRVLYCSSYGNFSADHIKWLQGRAAFWSRRAREAMGLEE